MSRATKIISNHSCQFIMEIFNFPGILKLLSYILYYFLLDKCKWTYFKIWEIGINAKQPERNYRFNPIGESSNIRNVDIWPWSWSSHKWFLESNKHFLGLIDDILWITFTFQDVKVIPLLSELMDVIPIKSPFSSLKLN